MWEHYAERSTELFSEEKNKKKWTKKTKYFQLFLYTISIERTIWMERRMKATESTVSLAIFWLWNKVIGSIILCRSSPSTNCKTKFSFSSIFSSSPPSLWFSIGKYEQFNDGRSDFAFKQKLWWWVCFCFALHYFAPNMYNSAWCNVEWYMSQCTEVVDLCVLDFASFFSFLFSFLVLKWKTRMYIFSIHLKKEKRNMKDKFLP